MQGLQQHQLCNPADPARLENVWTVTQDCAASNAPSIASEQLNNHLPGVDYVECREIDDNIPELQTPVSQSGQQQPLAQFAQKNVADLSQEAAFNRTMADVPMTCAKWRPYESRGNENIFSANAPDLDGQKSIQIPTAPSVLVPGNPAGFEAEPDQLRDIGVEKDNIMHHEYDSKQEGSYQYGADWSIDDQGGFVLRQMNGFEKRCPKSEPKCLSQDNVDLPVNQLLDDFVLVLRKPLKCPVIGCTNAYKTQNGLRYHKRHGHRKQQLKENPDGTFSIVDPLTSFPYPGTVGMQRAKPYQCQVCHKRYKDSNGLRYHRQHNSICAPGVQLRFGCRAKIAQ